MAIGIRTRGVLGALVCLAMTVGCGTTPSPSSTPASDAATDERAPGDPLVSACEGGAGRSCLLAAQGAERAGELEEASRLFTRACELGEADGCLLAGGLLLEGGEAQLPEALELLARGCELGAATACYGAGLVAGGTYGGASDLSRAAELQRKGCELGQQESCARLGAMTVAGEGVVQDTERGRALLSAACEAGEAVACYTLGLHLRADGQTAEARDWLQRACEVGEPRGCTEMGVVHASGIGVPEDPMQAAEFFRRGCEAESPDPRACALYGWALWTGAGLPADRPRALSLFEASCDAGDPAACIYLAVAYHEGEVVDADHARAEELVGRACALAPSRCEWLRRRYEEFQRP